MPEPAVLVEGLTKKFDWLTAVDGISFEVEEGEVFGLLGPNGAGKTTTVRMICTLIQPTAGTAKVLGRDVTKNPIEVKASIGLLPETPSVYESLTAEQNLDFFGEMYQVSAEKRGRLTDQLLETFGLEGRRKSKVETFSKGMKQRLALARTLIHDPPIVFLDEPTSGLDPESAKMVRGRISEMAKEARKTVFLCTHNLVEAEELCSRVAIIKSGKIIMIGSPQTLASDEARPHTYKVDLKELTDELVSSIRRLGFVMDVRTKGGGMEVDITDPEQNAPDLVETIVASGGRIREFSREARTLEDIYLEAVKR
jgi:ABC-2 type transport system ATP-binding protein